MIDLAKYTYLFAQALDNESDPEYWQVSNKSGSFKRMALSDSRLPAIRTYIDNLTATGRSWRLNPPAIECHIYCTGAGLITIRPSNHDIDGRISPVLILFCAFSPNRRTIPSSLRSIPQIMNRHLTQKSKAGIDTFQKTIERPRLILFLKLIFLGRK